MSPGTNGYEWHAQGNWNTAGWSTLLNADMDTDPFVTNNITFTNNTLVTQNFVVTITLPISPAFGAPTQLFGSVSGALSDTNQQQSVSPFWATAAALAGDSIYVPLIDNAFYNPGRLLNDPFAVNVATVPLDTTPFGGVNFSNNLGPAANVSIGIRNSFTLSPGDSIGLLSTFSLVPAPSGLSLLALAGLSFSRRRR